MAISHELLERIENFVPPNASNASLVAKTEAENRPAYWSGVFALSLCVFAFVASEFMPVSLLSLITGDPIGISLIHKFTILSN